MTTDPLLIELARAAYTCPAARDALHDYWEERGIPQPLLLAQWKYVPGAMGVELAKQIFRPGPKKINWSLIRDVVENLVTNDPIRSSL